MFSTFGASLSLLTLRQRVVYFALVGARALSSLFDILGLALIGLVTGLAASSMTPNQPLQILGFTLRPVSQPEIVMLVVGILLVFALKSAIAISLIRITTAFLARVESLNATKIAATLLRGNLTDLHRYSRGEIVWASMGSISFATSGVLQTLATLISEGTLLLLVGVTFFVVDPLASVFVFVYFAIIIIIIQLVIGKILVKAGADSATGNSDSIRVLDDAIGAFRELTVLGKQDFYIQQFSTSRRLLASSLGTINFLGGMPRYVVETALMLGVVLFVGVQFLGGSLAAGLVTVGVFLTGGVRIMASLLPLQNAMASVKSQSEQAKLAQSVLAEIEFETGVEPHQQVLAAPSIRNDRPENPTGVSVELRNVSFVYPGSSGPAVHDLSMSIPSGNHVAIIGPSGAGKTTIVDLILGLLTPSSGELFINGIAPDRDRLLAQQLISYVPQRPGIVSGTIAQNVALGTSPESIDENQVRKALSLAHLETFVETLPDGIHTSVGAQSNALSGGQIQRLGLARALYTNPKLIVLDEATSALDAASEALVSQSIEALGNDVTVIVIAHRLSTVQHSDIVFVIDSGELIGSGSFAHVRETIPMVAEYVELMSFE